MNKVQQDLAMALLRKDVVGIKAALLAGADPNFVDGRGNTPLMEAIVRQDERAMECLVEAGAKVNSSNPELNPVDFARALKKRKVVAWLEGKGARATTPEPTSAEKDLYLAARTGKTATLQRALAVGVNLDRVFGEGTALCHAIYRGHEGMVRALLDAGASPGVTGAEGTNLVLRALNEAQCQAHFESMRALLAERFPHIFTAEVQADEYPAYDIDALLDENPEPVNQLHSILRGHEGPLREHELMFLAAVEARINIPWDGLRGWFNNLSDGRPLDWAVKGLEAMGASRAALIIRKTLTLFPDGLAPADSMTFQSCMSSLSADQQDFLDALDSEFYDADDDLDELALRWLRANRELFRQACR